MSNRVRKANIVNYRMDCRGWDQLFWNPWSISVLEMPSNLWKGDSFDQDFDSCKKVPQIGPSLHQCQQKQKSDRKRNSSEICSWHLICIMLSCSEVRGKKYSPKGRPGSTPNKGPICQKIFCQIDVKIGVQPFDPPESCVKWSLEMG